MAAQTVQVGDETITIGRLSVFKAIRVGSLLTGLLREVPDLSKEIQTYSAEYRATNTIKISRAAAELRWDPEDLAKVSEKAWEEGDGFIQMPAAPGPMEIAAHVLPKAFEEAHERLLQLVALLVIPNSQFRDAGEDGIDALIDGKVESLVHQDAAELVDLLVAAGEVIEGQFSGKAQAIRKIASSFGFQMEAPTPTTEPEGETETSPTSTTSKPTTSIDSAEPTDGAEPNPSTDLSESPVASSTG